MRLRPPHAKRIWLYPSIHRVLLTTIVFWAVLGCATSGTGRSDDLPEWFTSPESVYPNATYLSAVGGGENRFDAESQALAALAQSFEVRISVDSRTQERYRQIATETGVLDESELSIVQNIDVRSDMQLLNVRIAEVASDESGRYYALAVLERDPTAEVYRDIIRRNDQQIVSLIAEADSTESTLMRYALLSVASVLAGTTGDLTSQLPIIAPGTDVQSLISFDADQVSRMAADAAARVRTHVRVAESESNRFQQVIAQELSSRQFPVVVQDARMLVDGIVELSPLRVSERLVTVDWVININVADDTGSVIVAYQRSGRSSGSTDATARAFAEREIESALRGDFTTSMQNQFDRMVYQE